MRNKISWKDIFLRIMGLYFIFHGLLAIYLSIFRGTFETLFWGCYVVLIAIGIGMIKRNGALIAGPLSIVTGYLLLWNIDFFYQLIFNSSLWGITDYYFREIKFLARFVSLEHLFLVPISLIALYFVRMERKDSWKEGLLLALPIIIISKLIATESNVNCALYPCANFIPTFPGYFFVWLVIIVIFIFITNLIFYQLFKK